MIPMEVGVEGRSEKVDYLQGLRMSQTCGEGGFVRSPRGSPGTNGNPGHITKREPVKPGIKAQNSLDSMLLQDRQMHRVTR
jgi:hypothetical protein